MWWLSPSSFRKSFSLNLINKKNEARQPFLFDPHRGSVTRITPLQTRVPCFRGANKRRIKGEQTERDHLAHIYFERRCSTLRCDEAWQIRAVRARADPEIHALLRADVVGRDRTRSNELMPRSRGEGVCMCARDPDTRVWNRDQTGANACKAVAHKRRSKLYVH